VNIDDFNSIEGMFEVELEGVQAISSKVNLRSEHEEIALVIPNLPIRQLCFASKQSDEVSFNVPIARDIIKV
jgi:hypothetical protein